MIYIKKYKKYYKNNKSVEDKEVRKRVLEASKLLLSGKIISEIAEILQVSFYTIYSDLTVRLPKINGIDSDIIDNVKQTMQVNKEFNLILGRIGQNTENKQDKTI